MLTYQEQNKHSYDVLVNGVRAGSLVFDGISQNWMFRWKGDGSGYGNDLEQAKKLLEKDFEIGKKDQFIYYFGDYTYVK